MAKIASHLEAWPAAYLAARSLRNRLLGPPEEELALLPFLVDGRRRSVDVGGHTGVYTQALLEVSAAVTAVEANPELAARLKRLFAGKAEVIWTALSSAEGEAELRRPAITGLATIEPGNVLSEGDIQTFKVPMTTLDALDLSDVGFIKIDVEGHELEVLKGAQALLRRDRPTLLIEAEERHRNNAVRSLREYLGGFGYQGLMLDGGRLVGMDRFDPDKDQHAPEAAIHLLNTGAYSGRYINNFVFLA